MNRRYSSVKEAFEDVAKKYPNNVALTCKNKKMTYRELDEESNRFARYLQDLGVKPGEFVGIAVDKSMEFIVAVLAVLKIKAAYLPIDSSYPNERKHFFIQDTKVKIVITNQREPFHGEKVKFVWFDGKENGYDSKKLEIEVDPLDVACIYYTSGSTGQPKGAQIMHKGILRLVVDPDWIKITSEDRFLQLSNLSFDATTFEIWGALLNGATLCIYPHFKLFPQEVGEFLKKEKITQVLFSAALFNLMVDEELSSFENVRYIQSAGEAMSVSHAKKAFDALTNSKVINGYGPTENTVYTTIYTITNVDDIKNGVPIGKPISYTTVYILDQNLKPVPAGVTGEIYAGGEGVARGYLNRDDLTASRFLKDPFSADKDAKMYKTGDLGYFLPDGNIMFAGRNDSQVKVRGYRIEIKEIEEVVKTIHDVSNCVVLVCEDVSGEKQLALYVTGSSTLTEEKLRREVEQKLPKPFIPDFIILLDRLPVTPVGKVDLQALKSPRKFLNQREYKAPTSSLEQSIAEVWASVLKIKAVGRTDDFFRVGGHSINAAEATSLLSQALQIKISPTLIYEDSTLQTYARKIEEFLAKKDRRKILYNDLFWIWRNREVYLDPTIGRENLPSPKEDAYRNPKYVFLTGSSGFVGVFLLKSLLEQTEAQIYCHVRGNIDRVKSTMVTYGIWQDRYAGRIIPIMGDLEKPLLGMGSKVFSEIAERADAIFHVGALVNHVFSFDRLKKVNVGSVQEIIKLAMTKKKKPLHFTSTTGVFESGEIVEEEGDLALSRNLLNGYGQSKWVAEKTIQRGRKVGLLANVFRLSRVIGSSTSGVGPPNDFLWKLIQASIAINRAPITDYEENILPVDFVSEAMVAVAKKAECINKEYNLVSSYNYSYTHLFELLKSYGYKLKTVDYKEWRETLLAEAAKEEKKLLRAVLALFCEIDLAGAKTIIFEKTNLEKALKGFKSIPIMEDKLFKSYVDYYVRTGFLPPYA